nr:unnamed protein product [Digitaria exilis]
MPISVMQQATYCLCLIILLLLPLLLLNKLKNNRDHHGVKLPPGPWRLPVIGSFHHLLGKPHIHRVMTNLAHRLDTPLMYLKLGEVPVMVVASADAAREIMKKNDITFASRPWSPTIKTMIADGQGLTFAPYGDLWRKLWKITLMELLSARRVESFRRAREDEVTRLVTTIAATLPDEDCHGDLFPSSWFINFVSGVVRRAKANHRKNSELMEWAIKQHEKQKREETMANGRVVEESIVDVLLRIQKDSGNEDVPLSMGTIKAHIIDLFVGGTGTTATTLQWAMSELEKNPDAMTKAQDELRHDLNGKPTVTEDDLLQMKYLKPIVKETLRLHPPGPLLLPKESRASCKILGYDVPKGTTVLMNAWAIGRDPKFWEDAEVFEPERFEGNTIDFRGSDFEYIPFGAGRRVCPGMTFAQRNIELALAALLYHFNWKLPYMAKPSELDMEEEMGLTIRRKNDLILQATICVPLQSEK